MVLDILILVVIAVLIALAAAEGLIRTLIMTFGFYLLTILLGMVVVAFNLAQALGDAVLNSLQGPTSPFFYQGMIFLALLIPSFVILLVISHFALSDTSLEVLGWLDNVLGTLLGIGLALVFAAIVCNSWGVIVSQQWRPFNTWVAMRAAYDGSVLRPYMLNILVFYRRLLFPFATSGYPIFFVPQG
ncbi:MAG: CvpA family protein [Anaerolineae bacterium]